MDIVMSADGVPIAFETFGQGPPVVLVHGAFSDRTTTAALARHLAPDFTVVAYDRRGRGNSGDSPEYTVRNEIDDLSVVMRQVGRAVNVFGHSSGAILALEAAVKLPGIARVAAYEPPYILDGQRPRPADDLIDKMRALVRANRRDEAAALFLTAGANASAADVAALRSSPDWTWYTNLAHTLPYDLALCGPGQRLPAVRFAAIKVPALLIGGGTSPAWFRSSAQATAESIPNAHYLTLDGHDHGILVDPAALAPPLHDFFMQN
jgi:pimeloyl-ACP methyl ester carboxylesterase